MLENVLDNPACLEELDLLSEQGEENLKRKRRERTGTIVNIGTQQAFDVAVSLMSNVGHSEPPGDRPNSFTVLTPRTNKHPLASSVCASKDHRNVGRHAHVEVGNVLSLAS